MPNRYLNLKVRHQKEFDKFPMFFAFTDKSFAEGMKRLGLSPTDTDKIYSLKGTGGYYRKTDAATLQEMTERHRREIDEAIAADETGTGFIYEMFNTELANHEYIFTESTTEALEALGLTYETIAESKALTKGLQMACKNQLNIHD